MWREQLSVPATAAVDTLVDIENIFGSKFNDLIIGDANRNTLNGFSGNDEIYGEGGSDRLLGQAGDDFISGGPEHDVLEGGAGNDTLNGGPGDDTLIGGNGADIFEYTDANWGFDEIVGWNDGQDQLDLTALGLGFADFTINSFGNGFAYIFLTSDSQQVIFITGMPINAIIDGNDFA